MIKTAGGPIMSAVAVSDLNLSAPTTQFIGRPRELFIDGKWVPAKSGKTFPVVNPATGDEIAQAAEGDKADIDAAVAAARRAFENGAWPAMTPSARGRLIHKIGDLILENLNELAELESLDNGKPVTVAR